MNVPPHVMFGDNEVHTLNTLFYFFSFISKKYMGLKNFLKLSNLKS